MTLAAFAIPQPSNNSGYLKSCANGVPRRQVGRRSGDFYLHTTLGCRFFWYPAESSRKNRCLALCKGGLATLLPAPGLTTRGRWQNGNLAHLPCTFYVQQESCSDWGDEEYLPTLLRTRGSESKEESLKLLV